MPTSLCQGESGWCSDVTSTHGAWRHAGVRFLLSGETLRPRSSQWKSEPRGLWTLRELADLTFRFQNCNLGMLGGAQALRTESNGVINLPFTNLQSGDAGRGAGVAYRKKLRHKPSVYKTAIWGCGAGHKRCGAGHKRCVQKSPWEESCKFEWAPARRVGVNNGLIAQLVRAYG